MPPAQAGRLVRSEGGTGVATSPTVRQRQLGMRLRSIRQDLGLNVDDVATELLVSASKISRLETASRAPNLRDIKELSRVYKLDADVADELMQLARRAKEPGWWSQYTDLRLEPYIGLEQDASAITAYGAFYVPALLQTEEYARAIITGVAPRMDPSVLNDRIEVRLRRQEILDGTEPPRYRILIDEAVLHRSAGGPQVMAEQLEKILKLAADGKVIFQIVPFEAGAVAAQDSNFVLLEFDNSGLPSVIFIEGLASNQIFEKKADIDSFREAFENLRDNALTPRESISRMNQMRKHYAS
jgi:transcriptional regulator with XRE-family HTH domain